MEKAITKIEIFVNDRTINLIFNLLRLIKKVLYSLLGKKKNEYYIYYTSQRFRASKNESSHARATTSIIENKSICYFYCWLYLAPPSIRKGR